MVYCAEAGVLATIKKDSGGLVARNKPGVSMAGTDTITECFGPLQAVWNVNQEDQ
jgi:hypothetical protein